MLPSLTSFPIVSLLAFLVALLLVFDGIALPALIGAFCGFAAVPAQAVDERRPGTYTLGYLTIVNHKDTGGED